MPAAKPSTLSRFQALDRFLGEHQALWQPRPFVHRTLAWESDHPVLATWLRRRSLAEADSAEREPYALAAPAPFRRLADRATMLTRIEALPSRSLVVGSRQAVEVPGRKWEQIMAFAAHLPFTGEPRHWLDWCGGKGHLGRLLATGGGSLTCLERDPALVAAGARLTTRSSIAGQHLQQDVMAATVAAQIDPAQTPVALHACGDLHVRLLRLAAEHGCRQLAVAPCCYNRTEAGHYQPLSTAARQSRLQLTRDDLGLPLSETVTAGARERRQRDRSMAWRLGFDLLQRQLRGRDSYLPTPSLATAWFRKTYAEFCCDLAALKGIGAPGKVDWCALETAGWRRLAEVRNLELVRALFRRPLELWLVLDRVMMMEEAGFCVQYGTFCPAELTPRNLMLLAER